MDPAAIDSLASFSYGDLVSQSIQRLEALRREYRQKLDSGVVPPEFPTHVQIQTQGSCNAVCPMCPMSDPKVRKSLRGRMDPTLFRKIVEECAAEAACKVISPYLQNEPLLDPDLASHIRLIKGLSDGRLTARIVTNGYQLTSERADELLAAGLDVISISLNAFSAETYRAVMGGLDYERTLANVEALLEKDLSRVLVILTFMVTSRNEDEIAEAIEYWSSRGVMCGAFGIGTMTGNIPDFDDVKAASTPARARECFVPLEATAILHDGSMLLCCSDWGRRSIFNNVAEASIRDIWHSEPLAAVRRDAILDRFDHEICQDCLGQTKVPGNLMYEGGPGKASRVG